MLFNRRALTPLESADPQNASVTPLESADPNLLDLKSFRIRTYKKQGEGGVPANLKSRPSACRVLSAHWRGFRGLRLVLLDKYAHRIQSSYPRGPGGLDARYLADLSISSGRGDGKCSDHTVCFLQD